MVAGDHQPYPTCASATKMGNLFISRTARSSELTLRSNIGLRGQFHHLASSLQRRIRISFTASIEKFSHHPLLYLLDPPRSYFLRHHQSSTHPQHGIWLWLQGTLLPSTLYCSFILTLHTQTRPCQKRSTHGSLGVFWLTGYWPTISLATSYSACGCSKSLKSRLLLSSVIWWVIERI